MKQIETLYVIDDDDIYQFITKKLLEETGLVEQIKIFSNGREALAFIEEAVVAKKQIPSIILLDLTMPIMDGWEFLEHFQLLRTTIGQSIFVYVVSSSVDPKDLERARSFAEVTDYLVKPLSKQKLTQLMLSVK